MNHLLWHVGLKSSFSRFDCPWLDDMLWRFQPLWYRSRLWAKMRARNASLRLCRAWEPGNTALLRVSRTSRVSLRPLRTCRGRWCPGRSTEWAAMAIGLYLRFVSELDSRYRIDRFDASFLYFNIYPLLMYCCNIILETVFCFIYLPNPLTKSALPLSTHSIRAAFELGAGPHFSSAIGLSLFSTSYTRTKPS